MRELVSLAVQKQLDEQTKFGVKRYIGKRCPYILTGK
jgi:hypothetical protein